MEINLNLDEFGIITKRQDDGSLEGGDSLANEGTYVACRALSREFPASRTLILSKFEYEPGVYCRHPDSTMWYAQPGSERISRDQMIPVLAACALTGDHARARRFAKRHLLRGLLFMTNTRRNGTTKENHGTRYKGNGELTWLDKIILKYRIPILPVTEGYRNYNWKVPDFTLIGFWALLIRALGFKILYPLLLILDVNILVSFMLRRFVTSDPDARNYILPLMVAARIAGTPLSGLTRVLSRCYLPLKQLITNWFTSPGESTMHHIMLPAMKKAGLID